jgi:hypothetical protein
MLHADRRANFSIGIDRSQGPEYKSDAQFYDHGYFPFFVLRAQTDDDQGIRHCVKFSGYQLSELRHALLLSWFTELLHRVPHIRPGRLVAQEDSMRAGPMCYQPAGLLRSLPISSRFCTQSAGALLILCQMRCTSRSAYLASMPCASAMEAHTRAISFLLIFILYVVESCLNTDDCYRRHDCLAVVSDSLVQSDDQRLIS